MNELLNIINEKGYPKAIVDYKRNFKKAIFDFDEILYMDYKKNIFINDKKIYGDPIDIWQSYIDSWKKTKNNGEIAAVGFFSYDFKNILLPDFPFKMCPNNKTPYFWFAKPSESINFPLCKYPHKKQKIKLKQNLMGIENFDKIINKIKKYLYNSSLTFTWWTPSTYRFPFFKISVTIDETTALTWLRRDVCPDPSYVSSPPNV